MTRPKAIDKPEQDSNVKKLGFDVTAMTVAEMKKAGITLVPAVIHVTNKDAKWVSHSIYAGMMPTNRPDGGRKTGGIDHDVIERGYARMRALAHFAKHKTLKGLQLQRSFPCLGTLRHVEWVEGGKDGQTMTEVHLVQCDVCGQELTVRHYGNETPESEQPDDYGGF